MLSRQMLNVTQASGPPCLVLEGINHARDDLL